MKKMKKEKSEEIQRWFGLETFYSDIMNNLTIDKVHHDEKAHWVLGISALIMSLTLSNIKNGFTLANSGYLLIFGSSLLAFLISLLILDMPGFLRRTPHSNKSLMYYHSYKEMSPDEYAKRLRSITSIEEISDQYAYNITNLVNRNNYPKRKYLKIPIYLLFFGILLGAILIAIFGNNNLIPAVISAAH